MTIPKMRIKRRRVEKNLEPMGSTKDFHFPPKPLHCRKITSGGEL
jgi:hypothetical protein